MYLSPRLCLSLALCFALHSATLSVNAKAPEGEVLAAPINRLPQGGGVIYPAWKGEYWANPVLEGSPAYARSDIRVSFDWETWRPVLGVHAESVRNFPRDRFSARWTGQLLARFDEDYTLSLLSSGQARLKLKRPGQSVYQVVIEAWTPHARRTDTAVLRLRPGELYEVVIEYAHAGASEADSACELRWASAGTPEEVVDYVSGNSTHFMYPHVFADLASFSGTDENSARLAGVEIDANGWPKGDFSQTLLQGYTHHAGRLLIAFDGQAQIKGDGKFLVGEESFVGLLPKGKGYDAATNRTRAYFDPRVATNAETVRTVLDFGQTQRSASSPSGSGLTRLSVMCARKLHGTESHEPGEIIHQPAREALLPVFSFRVQRTGLNEIEKWEERTLPSYARIMGQKWRADMAYEKLILAANEIGRDLHLCYSDSADAEFMRNLARLAKYGSDGVTPYAGPTPNPVYPPLNPNLRLYLEHGNEMGWSGIQPRRWSATYEKEIHGKADHPIWKVINFDGRMTNDRQGGLMRYHAYRTVMMSDAMRSVWGSQAMGPRIRVMLFGQYERWFQNGMLQFIEDYYNNPAQVAEPRAVSRILWAAGPAVYYGTTNNFAEGGSTVLTNHNFEDSKLAPGEAVLAPSQVPGWTFEGGAGLIDNRGPRHLAFSHLPSEAREKVPSRSVFGFRITVGERDLYVHQVCRWVQAGEKGFTNTTIVDLAGKTLYESKHATMNLGAAKEGELLSTTVDHCGWATSDSSRGGLWRLLAGQSYYVLTEAEGPTVPSGTSTLTAGPGLVIDGPAKLERGRLSQRGVTGGKIDYKAAPSQGYPLPTFRYAFADTSLGGGIVLAPADPLLEPSWPEGGKGKSFVPKSHRAGTRFAFLAGQGKLRQTFKLTEAGEYAVVFTANSSLNEWKSREGENPFTIRLDDVLVWDSAVGESRKPKGGLFQWGTLYTQLEAGSHTLTIESRSRNPKDVVYFYALHLGSINDFVGGPTAANFLGAGAATGQTDGRFAMIAELCTAMAQNWGLVAYAYEGGTNAGGDWGGGKLDYAHQFKWKHPLSKVADNQWARFWHNYGGANAFYYYPGFEYKNIHRAFEYMPWAAATERAHTWVYEPQGPPAAPLVLTPATRHYQSSRGSQWEKWYHPFVSDQLYAEVTAKLGTEGQWKGFVFRAPRPGKYRLVATTQGEGSLKLIVNDSQAISSGPAGLPVSITVTLTQGIHAVRVQNTTGNFELQSLEITPSP